ncbi:MAG: HlyD family secretion protein [Planctomyces sp.]
MQIHAPVSGIISQIHVEDGSVVQESQLIAELTSSTLESEILKTQDLLTEIEANLKRLKSGTRREEIDAATDRVRRLTEWYDLGAEELRQAKLAHEQDLLVQEHRVREFTAELNNARQDLQHSEYLYRQGALAGAQLRQQRLEIMQVESRLAQVQAALSGARAMGVRAKEAEISRRAQELADATSRLQLLQAGSRPEEIAAEEARRERASHELAFQKSRFEKLKIVASTSGIFAAPRLKERLGMAVAADSLFGTIEKPETSRVEIAVSEDEAMHLRAGQPVSLKARAIPFETFEATVESISPSAQKQVATGQNSVIVHCQIRNPDGRLKPGMTGFGKVISGKNTMGMILLTRGIRYFRTEFWW